jgi:hypothetical protein
LTEINFRLPSSGYQGETRGMMPIRDLPPFASLRDFLGHARDAIISAVSSNWAVMQSQRTEH